MLDCVCEAEHSLTGGGGGGGVGISFGQKGLCFLKD